ncbi:DNA polymerase I [Bacillota bacterium Meth-B3]
MAEKMVMVDGNSLMYRAFHALPLLDNGEGVYTNAVFGFLSMLLKVISEERPTYCAVAFDLHGPTFRHEQYDAYKAGRAPTPDELRPQVPLLKDCLTQMHIPIVSLPRYEADDMLGTLSRLCEEQGIDALVITGDRDAFQLAGERTTILYTKRGITDTERVTPAFLMEKYALTPDQMIDLKGLMGDSSDNIPGVPGVGEKTALKLLGEHGTLERVLETASDSQKGKLRERLIEFADQARFSKVMATVERNVPLDIDPRACRLHDMADALPALEALKLKSLAARLSALPAELRGEAENKPESETETDRSWRAVEPLPDAVALRAWAETGPFGQPMAVAMGNAACSVAFEDGRQAGVATGGDLLTPGLSLEDAVRSLARPLAEARRVLTHDVKALLPAFDRHGIAPRGAVEDVMLAAYALNPQRPSFALGALLEAEGLEPGDAATSAARLFELAERQAEKLKADGLMSLYKDIELKLAYTLYEMEREGFLVDEAELKRLGEGYAARIADLTARIQALSGGPININSPKQLGELLFGKLGLPGGRKTATGYSTTAEVLESLADRHEIVPLILEYRKYFKLNSTYIEALLKLRGPDGRIHTSFDQVGTATGRLSSSEPNLQNIPVRTSEGREIRRAFVAREGWVLVDADYSQIELRVLAHMARDPVMLDAFRTGQDIHQRTAAEVYGVALEAVTPEMRSAAKAVNFGIVYGISDFGLARNINVTRGEAAQFIERYFERYPYVKRFMDAQVAEGKAQGYVTTLFGRRRYLPELKSPNYNTRSFGERAAMNSPIQGTAADIIKLAMIRASAALRAEGLEARLILQVHDELIVECPEAERARVEALLKDAMEGAAHLDARLAADVRSGSNWHDCKG